MKTCKTGCGKMKAGGTIKKVKKMATGGQALNKAKGFAKATTGGDNVSKQIYGIPNAGTTGPNRTATYDYKKGGAIKKYPDGGSTIDLIDRKNRREIMRTPSGKLGVGASIAGIVGVASKMIADKIKSKKAEKKASEEKKKKDSAAPKAKFGATVNVQRGYPGKIRSAGDQGYTAIGNREPERTKFAKGGFPDLNKDGKITKADILKGRGVIKKKGGAVKKK
jgi:hypothetical protein